MPEHTAGVPPRRRWLLGLAALPVLGSGGCAWFDDKQNQFALRPTPGRPAGLPPDEQLFRPGDQRWLMPLPTPPSQPDNSSAAPPAAQHLAMWWLPHADPQAPTLLYLHGTFRNLYGNLPKINALREIGFSVLAVDYRGWGDSTALVPSEATITADAALAWTELQRRQPTPGLRVIYGHSMGGAVAVRLAADHAKSGSVADYGAVVLESTFTRMPDVAAEAGWWGRVVSWFTRLEFDSLARIGRITAPLLMLHGTADRTVPLALGRRLRDAAAAGVRWVEIEGGTHSRLHSEAPAAYAAAFKALMTQLKP